MTHRLTRLYQEIEEAENTIASASQALADLRDVALRVAHICRDTTSLELLEHAVKQLKSIHQLALNRRDCLSTAIREERNRGEEHHP